MISEIQNNPQDYTKSSVSTTETGICLDKKTVRGKAPPKEEETCSTDLEKK